MYYVNKPTASTEKRNTIFNLQLANSVAENETREENLKWKIDGTLDSEQMGKLKFTLPITEKDDKTVMSIAGSPTQTSKTVNVKWVNEDKVKYQMVPPAIQSTTETVLVMYQTCGFKYKILKINRN